MCRLGPTRLAARLSHCHFVTWRHGCRTAAGGADGRIDVGRHRSTSPDIASPSAVNSKKYHPIAEEHKGMPVAPRPRYLLSHGVKEGLVAHARDWPGVHCVRELLAGEAIRGLWFNRTAEYAARNRGEDFDRLKYATEQTFELTPLPCWSHLSAEAYQERVASLVTEIESQAAAELAKMGREPLGVSAILRQHPHTRPSRTKKSSAPFYHAATKAVRKAFWQAYAAFVLAFREATDQWREGDRKARFPVGSFPPGLPFVTEEAYSPP
jgi:hypothetical protein